MASGNAPLRVGVAGCGLIGRRRAREVARSPHSQLVAVADARLEAARETAAEFAAHAVEDWRELVADPNLDVIVVSTPNGYLAEIAIAALAAGKHVLTEKPMGRNVEEARAMAEAAERSGKRLKVGFNHRYHPALRRAHALFAGDAIGTLINLRVRYGHGGRAGYEREWRGDPELAGGGELTDQGVHALDLIHWFAGMPSDAVAFTQTAVWPIAPLEDNAFALLRFPGGAIASVHTSWTQWKNLFSFEVFGNRGALIVEGLGGSYGVETLTLYERAPAGGAPATTVERFEGADESWRDEWSAFTAGILHDTPYDGGPADGLAVMTMLADLYRAALGG
ncbi:MAG: Gfo/Idh/MocA family oxidoreductase [Candidatus Eremiobacteraeota bacterium]|nr:Gfo/Idh/MocA family oxidoreductase [Candidatus Eremiobacteraeota bacterium]